MNGTRWLSAWIFALFFGMLSEAGAVCRGAGDPQPINRFSRHYEPVENQLCFYVATEDVHLVIGFVNAPGAVDPASYTWDLFAYAGDVVSFGHDASRFFQGVAGSATAWVGADADVFRAELLSYVTAQALAMGSGSPPVPPAPPASAAASWTRADIDALMAATQGASLASQQTRAAVEVLLLPAEQGRDWLVVGAVLAAVLAGFVTANKVV